VYVNKILHYQSRACTYNLQTYCY